MRRARGAFWILTVGCCLVMGTDHYARADADVRHRYPFGAGWSTVARDHFDWAGLPVRLPATPDKTRLTRYRFAQALARAIAKHEQVYEGAAARWRADARLQWRDMGPVYLRFPANTLNWLAMEVSEDAANSPSTAPTKSGLAPASGFRDVPLSHPARSAVALLERRKIMQGAPDRRFYGDLAVSPDEWAVALARAATQIQAQVGVRCFVRHQDPHQREALRSNHGPISREVRLPLWSLDAVQALNNVGECPCPPAGPDGKPITRYEFARMLASWLHGAQRTIIRDYEVMEAKLRHHPEALVWEAAPPYHTSSPEMLKWMLAGLQPVGAERTQAPRGVFSDLPRPHPAADAVKSLAQRGIFTGDPDERFHGERRLSAGEFAVAILRMAQDMQRQLSCPPAIRRTPASQPARIPFNQP